MTRDDDDGGRPAEQDGHPPPRDPVRRRSPRPDDDVPVLPDRAGEDRPEAWGERSAAEDDDERYLRERPPHW